MWDGKNEQERLRRLKEKQILARDPKKKERQYQQFTAERERKRKKSYTLGDLWNDIPLQIRYALGGFLIGLLIAVLLPYFWDSPWQKLASFAIVLILTIYGVALGNGIATRENIKDQLRR